jgi:hypothetical protein
MDLDEDVLVLMITSHGSREEGVAVTNGDLPLESLEPAVLARALQDSGIKWRVVIVSACYAGIFVEPLKNPYTLIITAADARHSSFGCDDEGDLTWFGEAFLQDSLPHAPSLEAAFSNTRALIRERESEEGLRHSRPQIYVGKLISTKLGSVESGH